MVLVKWICRIVASVIMLQTLYFKFSAQPESLYIFTTIGMEPWGRIGSGIVELVASILLCWPHYSWIGAVLGIGVMSGALVFHLTLLGIEIMGDGGVLFVLALFVFVSCSILLVLDRKAIVQKIFAFQSKCFSPLA